MRILGIDPGLQTTGYSVMRIIEDQCEVLSFGEIITKPTDNHRLKKIYSSLMDIISSFKPDLVFIEKTFVNINPTTSITLGVARGMCLLACEMQNIHYLDIAPTAVKKFFCGKGNCLKQEVQRVVLKSIGMDLTHNVADAIAIGISGISIYHKKNYNLGLFKKKNIIKEF